MKLEGNTFFFSWIVGEESVTVTMRRPTPTELDKFYRERFTLITHGPRKNQVDNHQTEARLALVDAILKDVGGLEVVSPAGADIVLGKDCRLSEEDCASFTAEYGYPVKSWRDLVPPEWRVQWAQRFEEGAGEAGEAPVPLAR